MSAADARLRAQPGKLAECCCRSIVHHWPPFLSRIDFARQHRLSLDPTGGIIASNSKRSGLLVSVRSAREAREALAGGANLIDVKEPSAGPLGRAQQQVIDEVVAAVGGRVSVSAALGELAEWKAEPPPTGIQFVKWGLANLAGNVRAAVQTLIGWEGAGRPVLVAYADFHRANSPPPDILVMLACQLRFSAFLFDTAVKDGSTLLDWIEPVVLTRMRSDLAIAGVRVALAGSLGASEITALALLAPDWFAVRGAACDGGRTGQISRRRVRDLSDLISDIQNRRHED